MAVEGRIRRCSVGRFTAAFIEFSGRLPQLRLRCDCYLHLDERRWGCCCLLHDFLIESTTKTGQSMDSLHARLLPAYFCHLSPFSLTAPSPSFAGRDSTISKGTVYSLPAIEVNAISFCERLMNSWSSLLNGCHIFILLFLYRF